MYINTDILPGNFLLITVHSRELDNSVGIK